MRAAYGAGVREFLPANLRVREVIDFGDLPLFTVAAYPAVLIGSKAAKPDGEAEVRVADMVYPIRKRLAAAELPVNHTNVRMALEDLPAELDEAAVAHYPQALLRKDGILEDPRLVRLFDRLIKQGKPLGDYTDNRIFMGVKTGLNEAFVIDQAKRDQLAAEDARSAEVIKPWLRGKDILRWEPRPSGLYLIFASRGFPLGTYPAIEEHLSQFRSALERRATANVHPWYELQQPQEGFIWSLASRR